MTRLGTERPDHLCPLLGNPLPTHPGLRAMRGRGLVRPWVMVPAGFLLEFRVAVVTDSYRTLVEQGTAFCGRVRALASVPWKRGGGTERLGWAAAVPVHLLPARWPARLGRRLQLQLSPPVRPLCASHCPSARAAAQLEVILLPFT